MQSDQTMCTIHIKRLLIRFLRFEAALKVGVSSGREICREAKRETQKEEAEGG